MSKVVRFKPKKQPPSEEFLALCTEATKLTGETDPEILAAYVRTLAHYGKRIVEKAEQTA